jgi:hypothetical protein
MLKQPNRLVYLCSSSAPVVVSKTYRRSQARVSRKRRMISHILRLAARKTNGIEHEIKESVWCGLHGNESCSTFMCTFRKFRVQPAKEAERRNTISTSNLRAVDLVSECACATRSALMPSGQCTENCAPTMLWRSCLTTPSSSMLRMSSQIRVCSSLQTRCTCR